MRTNLVMEPLEDQRDGEVVHKLCEWCDSRPRQAACGVDLRGHKQAHEGLPGRRCEELWRVHMCVPHRCLHSAPSGLHGLEGASRTFLRSGPRGVSGRCFSRR